MKICPFCASENIFFSKKRNRYYCEDCENGFDTPTTAKGMRIFLSYGHDKNAEVVKRIKEYLTNKGYDVWIDTSEIPAGKDWRERITNGLIGSNGVISFLSKHSVRNPGVCLDELKIAVCIKNAYIKTVLLENENEVNPPSMVCNTQWIDMSDWMDVSEEDWNDYFEEKMALLLKSLSSDEATQYADELDKISSELSISNNTSKEHRLLKQIFVGRGWLMKKVNDWFADRNRDPFIIYGVPGSGKSAFAANLAQYNPDVLTSMFFEWDHYEFRSVDTVIKHFAFKLAAAVPDYRRMLLSLCNDAKLNKYNAAALFDYLILNPLQCCIDGNRGKGIVIFDGLDEVSSEVSELLIRKSTQLPSWIKVLFTSRYDASTVSLFAKSNIIMLDDSLEQNINDIKEYLAYRLDLSVDSDKVCKLAEKSEGSFLYAVSFCDAIDNGSMSLNDANRLPSGLFNFYHSFFKRLFETRDSFLEMRPFLELLCVNDDLPEDVITECLGLDRYGLWELRLNVKSLVTNAESSCGVNTNYRLKTIQFVHQSIKDWLTDPTLSGEFFIDVSKGYKRLSKYYEKQASKERQPLSFLDTLLLNAILAVESKKVTVDKVKEVIVDFEAKRAENEARLRKQAHDEALASYASNNYVKWLILGEEYAKAEELLLSSFDLEEKEKNYNCSYYTEYYEYVTNWQWVDMFPADYPIEPLVQKLTEIVTFPRSHIVSRYAHRSLQISLFLLSKILDSGRFAKAFFAVINITNFSGYFTSRASDDGETRDGWDKYYMTRDAAICIKKLDKLGIPIPDGIRYECERMKLTYNFMSGDPDEGMFYGETDGCWNYGILSEPGMFKDVCIIGDAEGTIGVSRTSIMPLLVKYNSLSLSFYLANSDEEDISFIKRCIDNHADLIKACDNAILSINKGKTDHRRGRLSDALRRIEFIRSLPERFSV